MPRSKGLVVRPKKKAPAQVVEVCGQDLAVSDSKDTLEEETVAEVLRRFISAMTEGDTEVRRTVAEYLGIVMLASKHSG